METVKHPAPRRRGFYVSLYTKVAVVIILVGSVPILLFAAVLHQKLLAEYRTSLQGIFANGLEYASYATTARLDTFNELSKFSYYYSNSSEGQFDYNYGNYDNLRRILTGEAFPDATDPVLRTQQEMSSFLNYLCKTNNSITAAHFLYCAPDGQETIYHHGAYQSNYFLNDPFREVLGLDNLDRTSKDLLLYPAHRMTYAGLASSRDQVVLTIARNYFNLTGPVDQEKYVGTLFIDLDVQEFNDVFSKLEIPGETVICVVDSQNNCYFSSDISLCGQDLTERMAGSDSRMILSADVEGYPLRMWSSLDTTPLEAQIQTVRSAIYMISALSALALLFGALFFSRSLTRPIRLLMDQMRQVGSGRLQGNIPVTSNDELGDLTARFNQMTHELEAYTNQVYVAKIRQTEAELTALKSQIYPHFLYNTLEVIRMTAISNQDETVGRMVEALSDQIRYLIGTVSDTVPLRMEVDMLQKYLFLCNCRFDNKVEFLCRCTHLMDLRIPKLILQPIVENAFVHGIKPMDGKGCILLEGEQRSDTIVLTVLDNGVGMDQEAVQALEALLASDDPGKRTDWGWESIGLKNVHDRVRYLYGEQYGISLFSTPGVGTVVKITLPGRLAQSGPQEEGKEKPNVSGSHSG